MLTTIYKSSGGDKVISEMHLSHAKNSLNKLIRTEPGRQAEIDALQAHVDKLSAEAEAKALAGPSEAVIGHNNPPEPMTGCDKFEARAAEIAAKTDGGRSAIETHADDLLLEAANWGDGMAIENDGQAAAVGKLLRDLQAAGSLVDDNAAKEKKPLNESLTEIAKWQNAYTAKGLKKTPDGKLTKAIAAMGRLSAAWLQKAENERKAREKAAADAALAAAQESIALRAEAKETTDLSVMDRAEDALAGAKALLHQAESVAKEKVRVDAGEGQRAVTLRSVWTAQPTGEPGCWGLAYGHYKTNPEFMTEFHALIQRWADRDARTEATRVRGVPGFALIETKVV